ncbi:MAG: hypothetical protein AAB737_00610, partial [Patescibacteria group bacterium]
MDKTKLANLAAYSVLLAGLVQSGCIPPPGALFHTSIATLDKCPAVGLPTQVVSGHTILEKTTDDYPECGASYIHHEIDLPRAKGVISNGYFRIEKQGTFCN